MDKILCVDDDANILSAFTRQLRKFYRLTTCTSAKEALELIKTKGPFCVVVADMQMPEMNGIELLQKVREINPHTVRIMLTGNADMQTAIGAVNEGNVFRFLCKPCTPEDLAKALKAALEQYNLVMVEQNLLQETLAASVQVLGELLSLANPIAFGRAARIRDLMGKIAPLVGASQWEFEVAGMLSQIGALTLPAIIMEKVSQGKVLSPEEQLLYDAHPQTGSQLVANIPRFENISKIIALQETRADENGLPLDSQAGTKIPIGARALHVVLDFDTLVRSGQDWYQALGEVERAAPFYDPQIVEAIREIVNGAMDYEIKELRIAEMDRGMVLEDDIKAVNGAVIKKAKGEEVTLSLRSWMQNIHETTKIREPIRVRVYRPKRQSASKPAETLEARTGA
ncbi:MAG: HD domain-containing phosphohydrolase [Candidatus Sumerlaeia bacterium]